MWAQCDCSVRAPTANLPPDQVCIIQPASALSTVISSGPKQLHCESWWAECNCFDFQHRKLLETRVPGSGRGNRSSRPGDRRCRCAAPPAQRLRGLFDTSATFGFHQRNPSAAQKARRTRVWLGYVWMRDKSCSIQKPLSPARHRHMPEHCYIQIKPSHSNCYQEAMST